MAASALLLCASAARILLPFFLPLAGQRQARDHEPRSCGGVPERTHDCVEVDRAEAPGGGSFFDDDASSAEEGPRAEGPEQERRLGLISSSDQESSSDDDPCDDGERRRRFYFVDTGSYYRTFYDLLAFWRSMEREAPGAWGCKKCSIYKVKRASI
ncbi:hypothetical protein PVAP13_2NG398000 [Panicum virgatum]|uniref:Uncharacterized protein n=1 Tax=Panicum virgatum TaxID=38727 RepID=A0A8T0VW29_PANVG|nr:hypothetical protein PVAP13_2NG398000 [Panicum virgatum]